MIETWAPLSTVQYWMTINLALNTASSPHQSYHCGMLLWCQMINKGAIARVQGLWLFLV